MYHAKKIGRRLHDHHYDDALSSEDQWRSAADLTTVKLKSQNCSFDVLNQHDH